MNASVWKGCSLCEEFSDYVLYDDLNDSILVNIHEDYLNLRNEYVRKLSFTLQLSEPDEYEGGNVQFIDDENKTFFAPRQRGSMVLFDSRTQHRVLKVKKGVRRSIVGWVLGPRWK